MSQISKKEIQIVKFKGILYRQVQHAWVSLD